MSDVLPMEGRAATITDRRPRVRGHVVEVVEARRRAGDVTLRRHQTIDPVDGVLQQFLGADWAAGLRPPFRDLEHLTLGFVEQFLGLPTFRREGGVGNLVRGRNELPKRRALATMSA